ncbi:MAG: group III truncated hemoglobin [Flavobacterium sp.]|uniref:group III truncated hemoglobin n=1 Tax=Flavobacterium sp. TaxID=239 RepID=UPI0012022C52|nr:group III truncated hemoglobin [Flavobacterium sp.]RZJ64449.1 MAG: group III truncated hemoglobin [Flavobacterium sp.]
MAKLLTDIESRADLELLLSRFYEKLLRNHEMHRIFIDVMKINLEAHLPTIADFWEQVLFGTGDYRRNAMQIHVGIHERTPLSTEHFKIWFDTFKAVVHENFAGENAEKTITRALSVGTIIQTKLQ